MNRILIIGLSILLTLNSFSQVTINGIVKTEDDLFLPGVLVTEKGTENSCMTDINGSYELTVSDSSTTLTFGSVGYITQEIVFDGQSVINITLKEYVHYNYSDTINDSFASYYIKTEFERLKLRLKELKEDSLTHIQNSEVNLFRILTLPSFQHPICFTISNKNEKLYLNWTVGKGSGGYEPKGVKKKGKVRISKSDWENIFNTIDISSFDTLPIASYLLMNDGTSWIIEKNIDNAYQVYFTNMLLSKIEDGYALLTHISGIKNKEFIYFYDSPVLRIFNKDNELLQLEPLQKKIVEYLNEDFKELLQNKEEDYCFDWDIYIKINSNEKVKKVKYIPYRLPYLSLEDRFEYFADNYADRKFRKEVKKSLKKLNLSELKLSENIWVPVYIKCNKEKKVLEVYNNY